VSRRIGKSDFDIDKLVRDSCGIYELIWLLALEQVTAGDCIRWCCAVLCCAVLSGWRQRVSVCHLWLT